MTDKNHHKGWALGAIFGAIAGLVTGLLAAPKSGKETRGDIKKTADSLGSEAEKQLKKLYHDLVAISDRLRIQASSTKGKAKKDIESLEAKATIMRQKLGELLSTIRDGAIDDKALKNVVKDAEKIIKDLQKVLK